MQFSGIHPRFISASWVVGIQESAVKDPSSGDSSSPRVLDMGNGLMIWNWEDSVLVNGYLHFIVVY